MSRTKPFRHRRTGGWGRAVLVRVAAVFAVCTAVAVLAEIALRFMPVSDTLETQPVNAAAPVMRFAADRDVVWSCGWDFDRVNRIRVNNAGFVSGIDYDADAATPLLAVIGDSYVEAAMVPAADTVQSRLVRRAASRGRVYAFGASGAALSQYLMWADMARQRYRPAGLVVVVVGNDFHESLLAYKQAPGFHYFEPADGGSLALHRVDFAPGPLRRTARRSALARYLLINVNVERAWHRMADFAAGRRQTTDRSGFVGNVPARQPENVVNQSKRAVDAFLALLPAHAGLSGESIVLVVDGLRQALYRKGGLAATEGSYFRACPVVTHTHYM